MKEVDDIEPVKESAPLLKDEELNYYQALKNVLKIALLSFAGTFFHPSYQMVNAMVLGHTTDPQQLGGVGLGSLTVGLLSLSIHYSFATGSGVAIAPAFGQGEKRLCAVYANRQLFLSIVLYFIIGAVLCFIRPIYDLLEINPEVADYATEFVQITYPFHIFELLGYVFNFAYAINCRVAHYTLYSYMFGAISHAIMIYIFCFVNDWGYAGVTWATALMFIVRGGTSFLCVKFGGDIESFPDVYLFSRETVSNLAPLLSLSLESVAMGIWGTWSLEIFALMASMLSTNEVGAQTIMRSIGMFLMMMPSGLGFGCIVFVGNSLGEGKPRIAMQYYRVVMFCAFTITMIQTLYMYFGREQIISAFTDQEPIVEIMRTCWPILIFWNWFDTYQVMGRAVMQQALKMIEASVLSFAGLFFLGIEVGYYLTFIEDMGIKGLWLGHTSYVVFLTIVYNIVISKIDFDELLIIIQDRTREEKEMQDRLTKTALQHQNYENIDRLTADTSKKEFVEMKDINDC